MAKQFCTMCNGTKKGWDDDGCTWCNGTGIETEWQDEPICPYCGEVLSEDELYESCWDECPECGGELRIEVDYTRSYSTHKKDKM